VSRRLLVFPGFRHHHHWLVIIISIIGLYQFNTDTDTSFRTQDPTAVLVFRLAGAPKDIL
jgi:hypothetical protein